MDEWIEEFLIQKFEREPKYVLYYLNFRGNLKTKDHFGTTLLHMVASDSFDNVPIVQYLIYLGADINVKDLNHHTPLHLAILSNNYKIADFLISTREAVNIQEASGKTALYLLIDNKCLPKLQKKQVNMTKRFWLVRALLRSGADPNLPDNNGETPLMRAVRQNDFDIVKVLLINRGNVHLRNIHSDTCLSIISRSFEPNRNILMELIKYGACLNCFGSQGSVIDSIFQHHRISGRLETIKLLIKTATLANWKKKIFFQLETNRKFNFEKFIDSCYTEISRMKSFTYSDKSTLCHFALIGGMDTEKHKSSGKSIFDEVWESLRKEKFPIYYDLIRAHFDRPFLFEKLKEMNIYARNKKEEVVYLNSYTVLILEPYLSDKDLFNLVIAYLNSDENEL